MSVHAVTSKPMFLYASACFHEIAPVPITPTLKSGSPVGYGNRSISGGVAATRPLQWTYESVSRRVSRGTRFGRAGNCTGADGGGHRHRVPPVDPQPGRLRTA